MRTALLVTVILYFYSIKSTCAFNEWTAVNSFEQKVFIQNSGQYSLHSQITNEKILFGARQDGLHYYFTKTGIVIKHIAQKRRTKREIESELRKLGLKEEKEDEAEFAYKMEEEYHYIQFVNSGAVTKIIGISPGSQDYLFGTADKGTIKATGFEKIIYKNIYPGIDLEFYFPKDKQGFKYSFIVHAGADPNQIQLMFPLAKESKLSNEGNLFVDSEFGLFTDHKPIASELNSSNPVNSGIPNVKK